MSQASYREYDCEGREGPERGGHECVYGEGCLPLGLCVYVSWCVCMCAYVCVCVDVRNFLHRITNFCFSLLPVSLVHFV